MNDIKKVNRKIKRKRRRVLFFTLLLVMVIFFIVAFKTSLFTISKIEVHGNKKVTTDKVVKAIGNPNGENIFRVNKKDMINNLQKHPYIKTSIIKRRIPNKLIVDITERQERVILVYASSGIYLDEEGFVLKIEPLSKDEKIPIIKGISTDSHIIGDKITSNQSKYIDDVLDFVDISIKLKLLEKMGQMDFSDMEDITIQLNDGIIVDFGPLNNVEYKLSYINEILKDVEEKNILCKYIYLNRGDNPVIVIDNN
ncbi:cell division protein FtsQ/DivIB [Anaerosalibacter sp. Marseille-P3206]|uniref:cell division protein FtsQ/DivIB n=1 Tax=Anaerosalibacter sp. Marseille-P3206 TaxID=1871005 RepID=UPI000987B2D0|nr:FtsQ-type POTRA domain-containing protein [Anaerosalibacter sp. Marseille-P3206]